MKYLLSIFLMCGSAMGQTWDCAHPREIRIGVEGYAKWCPSAQTIGHDIASILPEPELLKPLECPQYQHVDDTPECVNKNGCPYDVPNCAVVCITHKPTCVDDLHILTEKEWQELDFRIRWQRDEIHMLDDITKLLLKRIESLEGAIPEERNQP